ATEMAADGARIDVETAASGIADDERDRFATIEIGDRIGRGGKGEQDCQNDADANTKPRNHPALACLSDRVTASRASARTARRRGGRVRAAACRARRAPCARWA